MKRNELHNPSDHTSEYFLKDQTQMNLKTIQGLEE